MGRRLSRGRTDQKAAYGSNIDSRETRVTASAVVGGTHSAKCPEEERYATRNQGRLGGVTNVRRWSESARSVRRTHAATDASNRSSWWKWM